MYIVFISINSYYFYYNVNNIIFINLINIKYFYYVNNLIFMDLIEDLVVITVVFQ